MNKKSLRERIMKRLCIDCGVEPPICDAFPCPPVSTATNQILSLFAERLRGLKFTIIPSCSWAARDEQLQSCQQQLENWIEENLGSS